MASVALAFPILPGKVEDARRLAEEVQGPRRSEAAESYRRQGITEERWYIQHTPQGDMVIVTKEADNPNHAFEVWSQSNDPYDRWFKERAGAICGIDFSQPIPALPEQVFSYQSHLEGQESAARRAA